MNVGRGSEDWGSYLPYLVAELDSVSADVICLQNLQQSKYEAFLKPIFSQKGFSSQFLRVEGSHDSGLAIFVRNCSIELHDSVKVDIQSVSRFFLFKTQSARSHRFS